MRTFMFTAAVLLLASMFASGCAAHKSQLKDEGSYWFEYDASKRGALLVFDNEKSDMKFRGYCAEPSPDVAKEILDSFELSGKYKDLDITAKADISSKVVQLAKRSQTIMFLRESLYRLCELSLNYRLDKSDIKELYSKVIDAAITMAETEFKEADTANIKALTEYEKATQTIMEQNKKSDEIIGFLTDGEGKIITERLDKLLDAAQFSDRLKSLFKKDLADSGNNKSALKGILSIEGMNDSSYFTYIDKLYSGYLAIKDAT